MEFLIFCISIYKAKKMKWEAKLIKHKSEIRIGVQFEKNDELIRRIKLLADARWSRSLNVWHLPNTDENRMRFKIPYFEMDEEKIKKIKSFEYWLISKR